MITLILLIPGGKDFEWHVGQVFPSLWRPDLATEQTLYDSDSGRHLRAFSKASHFRMEFRAFFRRRVVVGLASGVGSSSGFVRRGVAMLIVLVGLVVVEGQDCAFLCKVCSASLNKFSIVLRHPPSEGQS